MNRTLFQLEADHASTTREMRSATGASAANLRNRASDLAERIARLKAARSSAAGRAATHRGIEAAALRGPAA